MSENEELITDKVVEDTKKVIDEYLTDVFTEIKKQIK